MTLISPNYASKLAIARRLAVLGARAVTITSVANTKPADSRAQYKLVRGNQSRSGQTPTDHQWFLANNTRKQHAAMLLLLYANYRQSFDNNPDAHGLAFVIAYELYVRLTFGSPVVSTERMNLLVRNGFSIGWRAISKGEPSKFSADNVKVIPCKRCNTPHLVEAHFRSFVCPAHEMH